MAQLMMMLDLFGVNVALPPAQQTLHFSAEDRQWVITACALAFGGSLLLLIAAAGMAWLTRIGAHSGYTGPFWGSLSSRRR
jgi:hypothetical protein